VRVKPAAPGAGEQNRSSSPKCARPTGGSHGLTPADPAQREGRAGWNVRSRAAIERSRARVQGRKDRRPPMGIAYAKRGLVRIGRKDRESAFLRPELRTKGLGRPEGCPGPSRSSCTRTAGPRPCLGPIPSDEGRSERSGVRPPYNGMRTAEWADGFFAPTSFLPSAPSFVSPLGGRVGPSCPSQPAGDAKTSKKSPIWGMRRPPVVC
jgi:hypothetical protein